MDLSYIIVALSVLFWIFPAFRHWRTDLFWYFFILAISDPISMSVAYVTDFKLYSMYIFFAFLITLSFYWSSHNKKFVRVMLLTIFLLLIISFSSSSNFGNGMLALSHAMILLLFFRRSIYFVAESSKVNIFHIVLILYETSIILKLLSAITEAHTGVVFFYATSFFQIVIAIFFSIFKEGNDKLFIDMRKV